MLADALALADEDKPALIADFATLTGAARVALGPDVPAAFTDDDALADELRARGAPRTIRSGACRCGGPTKRCWIPKSPTSTTSALAASRRDHRGAVPAQVRRRAKSWLHLDIFAWTPAAKPGRPEGAELQTARALYALL